MGHWFCIFETGGAWRLYSCLKFKLTSRVSDKSPFLDLNNWSRLCKLSPNTLGGNL